MALCLGATCPRDLPLPGRELDGIYQAMAFLETWQKKQSMPYKNSPPAFTAKDKDVVVLGTSLFLLDHLYSFRTGFNFGICSGGGDTGCDCIGTCLRQGARSITSFEILPPPPTSRSKDNPWPQSGRVFKVDYGHEEVRTKFGKDPRIFNMLSKVCYRHRSCRSCPVLILSIDTTSIN